MFPPIDSLEKLAHWADGVDYAVTICDINLRIVYMNQRSRDTFAKHGDIIGQSLLDCHPEHARRKIHEMIKYGKSNAYTITKNGQKKLIFQSPWRLNGEIAGLVETSMVFPPDMPHFNRDLPQ